LSAYADTSFVVSLYVPDANSVEAAKWMQQIPLAVLITALGELELVNAVQLRKKYRRLRHARLAQRYAQICATGCLRSKLYLKRCSPHARRLASRWTARLGTRRPRYHSRRRAIAWGAKMFLTFDDGQRKLATKARLKVAQRHV
jgi:hypothetical protein